MSQNALPNGVYTATLTPFFPDLRPNHSLLHKHCQSLMENGTDGIALLGTTGEANSISLHDRMEILEQLIQDGFPADRIIVGTGTCSLDDTVLLTKHAMHLAVGGILLMPPFFYRGLTEQGLYSYFARFFEDVGNNDLRVILYHFPKMSGVDFSNGLLARLIKDFGPQIAGMKDSSGDVNHMTEMIKSFPAMRLFAGNEKFLLPVLEAGGAGCISATTNHNIRDASAVYRSWLQGTVDSVALENMIANREAFEGHLFPAALKGMLSKSNPEWQTLLPPLYSLDSDSLDTLSRQLST